MRKVLSNPLAAAALLALITVAAALISRLLGA